MDEAVQQLDEMAGLIAADQRARGLLKRPIRSATDDFSKWLRMQTGRHDRIGAFARVAVQDPMWPDKGFESRSSLQRYFAQTIGARSFVVQTAGMAWDDYKLGERRARNRQKRKQQKDSRKRNRGKKRR